MNLKLYYYNRKKIFLYKINKNKNKNLSVIDDVKKNIIYLIYKDKNNFRQITEINLTELTPVLGLIYNNLILEHKQYFK